jgi:hypothetical protein
MGICNCFENAGFATSPMFSAAIVTETGRYKDIVYLFAGMSCLSSIVGFYWCYSDFFYMNSACNKPQVETSERVDDPGSVSVSNRRSSNCTTTISQAEIAYTWRVRESNAAGRLSTNNGSFRATEISILPSKS